MFKISNHVTKFIPYSHAIVFSIERNYDAGGFFQLGRPASFRFLLDFLCVRLFSKIFFRSGLVYKRVGVLHR